MNPFDLTTEAGVVEYMGGAESESVWNARCDEVKRANGGYPGFWYPAIVLSGVAGKTAAKWGGTDKMKISVIRRSAPQAETEE